MAKAGKKPKLAPKHKGAHSELVAASWLLSQGEECYRNLSQHGAVDLIGLAGDGTINLYNVKSSKTSVYWTAEAAALGLKFIVVENGSDCRIVELPQRRAKAKHTTPNGDLKGLLACAAGKP